MVNEQNTSPLGDSFAFNRMSWVRVVVAITFLWLLCHIIKEKKKKEEQNIKAQNKWAWNMNILFFFSFYKEDSLIVKFAA